MVGQVFGHYRIVGKLGAGGMGEVYRAHDEQLDRDVAIKVLPASHFRDDTARARLLREARAAAALNHPNICTIHEVGEADGQAYIAMELIEGRPLADVIPRGGLPVEEVLRCGSQIAGALAHAHERGIVHRDLKSGNVVITADGRAKVLDFGLAKRLSNEELAEATTQSQESLTQPGAVLGTLPYMAPEQLRGQGADARSDGWALGVVLHEMAAGARPFQGQTGYELSSAILNQPPGPLPAKVPVELRAVIERCLAKEPAQRYQRAGEVRAALEALATGAAVPGLKWKYLAKRRWFRATAAVVLLAALAAALLGLNVAGLRDRVFGPATPKIESIAVLPLDNLSGDSEQDYFVDGMHEELIATLGKVKALTVISRTSVMQYKQARKPLPEIAKELGVDAVVEGSVRRAGNQVRVTVQLVDARTDKRLWAESYQRELRDVLALQSEIARAITDEIRIAVTPAERTRLAAARPVNPEAYEAYLKGRYHMGSRAPNTVPTAIEYFNQAIEKDPSFALAYAGLSEAYAYTSTPAGKQRAKEAALKALRLDDSLAEAHASLGLIRHRIDWDWSGAEVHFRRAIELNPGSAMVHNTYANYLLHMKRLDEALRESTRARELDPLSADNRGVRAAVFYVMREYDLAWQEYQGMLDLFPNLPGPHGGFAYIHLQKGRLEEAVAEARRVEELSEGDPDFLWTVWYIYGRAGKRDEALRVLNELRERSKREHVAASAFAIVYSGLGDKDQAFAWLERAYQQREGYLPALQVTPVFDPLRDDPRFDDLLRRMNFPE